jgi:hypothetical protein
MTSQIHDLQKKCDKMTSIFSNTYFNAADANQGYTTVFAPSVKYVLPVTSISPTKLHTIQSRSVSSVLSRLGYNRHMPRQVVFASKLYGGIGLLNLPTEQVFANFNFYCLICGPVHTYMTRSSFYLNPSNLPQECKNHY